MEDFQRERFASLDPALIAVARGELPQCGRQWLEATKGASKDTDLAISLLWLLAFSPRTLTCQVGAADSDQADELRKAAKGILKANPWLAEIVEIQASKILNTRTESVAEIIPADVAGSHGARPDVLILNELTHVGKQEFAQNLLDNASKVPHGLVVVATNAGELDSWQWSWREMARTSARWAFHRLDRPAPWLDAAELEEAKLRNPISRFMRLFWGVWSSRGGDVAISDDDLKAAQTITTGPMRRSECDMTRYSFAGCIDLGWRHDRAAFAVLGCDHHRQRVRVAFVQDWSATTGRDVDLVDVLRVILEQARDSDSPRLLATKAKPS
jgi:hypothetical protein